MIAYFPVVGVYAIVIRVAVSKMMAEDTVIWDNSTLRVFQIMICNLFCMMAV
jgi:hypothetical protein